MDDRSRSTLETWFFRKPGFRTAWKPGYQKNRVSRMPAVTAAVLFLWSLSGCSLVVMTGKMLFGDPKLPNAFRRVTRVDLARQNKEVLFVCLAPATAKFAFPSLELDLSEQVARRLKQQGIRVVDSNKLIDWSEQRGGFHSDPAELANELARAFSVDYILIADLESFTLTAEESSNLYQGQTGGNVLGYEVGEYDGQRSALRVFAHEFQSVYPRFSPRSAHQIPRETFLNDYLRRVSLQLAQVFYDHPAREEIE